MNIDDLLHVLLGRSRRTTRVLLFLVVFCLAPTLTPSRAAAETISTLTTDALSFISFHGEETLLIPSGTTLRLRFGQANPDGSIPFTIASGDLDMPPVNLPSKGRRLVYRLKDQVSGVMRETEQGRQIDFTADVQVSFEGEASQSSHSYRMHFTTETASARDRFGDAAISVTGLRAVEGVWYTQLVGATTNATNAVPAPGAAVYTVLSGRFDQLPSAR